MANQTLAAYTREKGCARSRVLARDFRALPQQKYTGFLVYQKCLAFRVFENREACSRGGEYASNLHSSMKDRASDGYVTLPNPTKLRAAEIYDDGIEYQDVEVKVNEDEFKQTAY